MTNNAEEYAESVANGIRERHDEGAAFGYSNAYNGDTVETLDDIDGYDPDEHDADNLPGDWQRASAGDWLSDVLDLNYIVGSDRTYRHARVWLSVGGPSSYVDTEDRELVVSWGGDIARRNLPAAFCESIDDYLSEYFDA